MDILVELDIDLAFADVLALNCFYIADNELIEPTLLDINIVYDEIYTTLCAEISSDMRVLCYFGVPHNKPGEYFSNGVDMYHFRLGCVVYGIERDNSKIIKYVRRGYYEGGMVKGWNEEVYIPPGVMYQVIICDQDKASIVSNLNTPNPIDTRTRNGIFRFIDGPNIVRHEVTAENEKYIHYKAVKITYPRYVANNCVYYDKQGNIVSYDGKSTAIIPHINDISVPEGLKTSHPPLIYKIIDQIRPMAKIVTADPVEYIELNY